MRSATKARKSNSAHTPPNVQSIAWRLRQFGTSVNARLALFFEEQRQQVPDGLEHVVAMFDYIEEFCLRGGKRMRPYAVMCAANLGGKNVSQECILDVSIVPELIHAFLLVHDDIMDKSTVRRGAATLHEIYEKELPSKGNSLALLAGDLLYTLALRHVASLSLPDSIKMQILDEVLQAVQLTIHGQNLDVRLEHEHSVSPDDILAMYRLKTSYYSFQMPLRIGAIATNVPAETIEILTEYGLACGIAFQIIDDLLDVFGSETETGKILLGDLQQGKCTLVMARAWEVSSASERKMITQALGNTAITQDHVRNVQEILQKQEIKAWCENVSFHYIREAKEALTTLKVSDDRTKQPLYDIADFIGQRHN